VNRVTLDTNIYVNAFEFGGGPMRLLQLGMDGEVEVAVSQPIIDETMRVLRIKFGWSDAPNELSAVSPRRSARRSNEHLGRNAERRMQTTNHADG
jgi:hypothetical protein